MDTDWRTKNIEQLQNHTMGVQIAFLLLYNYENVITYCIQRVVIKSIAAKQGKEQQALGNYVAKEVSMDSSEAKNESCFTPVSIT